jgi:hypothetical protein
VAGLLGVQRGLGKCLELPAQCRPSDWAVEGSPAFRELDSELRYYLSNGLVAHLVPELTYVVPEQVRVLGADRAEITMCEVDGSWQMDSRRTPSTADDIIWDDLLVSRRARVVLARSAGRWRRVSVEELAFWPGENRCPPQVLA